MKTSMISKSKYPENTDKTTNGMMNALKAELSDLDDDDNDVIEEHEEDDFWLWFWDVLFGGINKGNSDEDISEEGVSNVDRINRGVKK